MSNTNIYKPYLMKIEKVTEEAPFVKTFRLKFTNEEEATKFKFKAGQFVLVYSFRAVILRHL